MPISADELKRKLAAQRARVPREQIIADNPLVGYLRGRGFELFDSGESLVTSACPVAAHMKPGHRPVSIDQAKQVWYCNDHKVGGSIIDWEMHEKNVDVAAAMQSLNGDKSVQPAKEFVCAYDYTDEDGKLLFQKVRFKIPTPKRKTFSQRRPNNGEWIWDLKEVRRVLYRLPQVTAAQQVIDVEGEKDADNLSALGFTATTNFEGAGKWSPTYSETLRGKDVVIFGDNDKDGKLHVSRLIGELTGVANSLRLVKLPAQFKDVSDYLDTLPEADRREAIAKLIEEAGELNSAPPLPKIEDAAILISEPITLPPPVVEGVAHRGEKISIGGASKAYKTWILSDLAISVATGTAWLGYFPTRRGKVLHLNFELMGPYFTRRLLDLTSENQVALEPGYLHLWNLRGYACDLATLLSRILERIKKVEYSLINLDPIYKVLGRHREENAAGHIADLLNQVELMAVRTGAAICYGAHYSKGNQAGKEAIDRVAGSGVFARDPDSLVNFTEHEAEDCFSVEITLRHHAPVKSIVVKWDYPVFRVDRELSPGDLKTGRPDKHKKEDLWELIDEPILAKDLIPLAMEEYQIPRRRVFELLAELKKDGSIKQRERRGHYERV